MTQRLAVRVVLAAAFAAHAALVVSGARRNFAGVDEAAHVAAGLSHWQTGTFSLYRVNPPLPDLAAALPVLVAGPTTDFRRLTDAVDVRPEWDFGREFARLNRERFLDLLFLARLPGLAWSLAAAWVIYRWGRDLYGEAGGCLGAVAWCFDPTVVAWAQAVTGDVPSASAAVGSTYVFWCSLKRPRWATAVAAGVLLGVGLLTKFTLVSLFGVWAVLVLIHRPWNSARWTLAGQGVAVIGLSLLVLNLGYGFRGTFRPLGEFFFVSAALSGNPRPAEASPGGASSLGAVGNRFRGTLLASLPVPLPADYVSGVDVLRVDFEDRLESYLRGEWRSGGWWYYYLYAFAVKEPVGTLLLVSWTLWRLARRGPAFAPGRDEAAWVIPAAVLLGLVSSQTGTNHHVRYVLPAFPFLAVGLGKLAGTGLFSEGRRWQGLAVAGLLGWSVVATVRVHPHEMSYFNEPAGGPEAGGRHLNDSNVDWGQDLLFLRDWLRAHPEARPFRLAYYNALDPSLVGVAASPPPPGPPDRPPTDPAEAARFGPWPGYYGVSVNYRVGTLFWLPDGRGGARRVVRHDEFAYFRRFQPVARAGYSIEIYHITPEQADEARRALGLPPLPDGATPR